MKRFLTLVSFFAILGCGFVNRHTNLPPDTILAATGKTIINPPIGIPMAGYSADRKVTGIEDDLYARCVALSFAGYAKPVVFVSVDLIGFLRYDVQLVKEALGGHRMLFIMATHTHSGPDTLGVYGGRDEAYMSELRGKIVRLVQSTCRNLEPAKLFHGTSFSRGLSHNWREPGEVDDTVNVLAVQGNKGLIATLVNFACHPEAVGKGMLVSADFPGYLVKKIEEKHGGTGLFVNGLLGAMVSINPEKFPQAKGPKFAKEFGEQLAEIASQSKLYPLSISQMSNVSAYSVPIRLENEFFKKAIEEKKIPTSGKTFQNTCIITETGILTIGRLKIVMIPGEMTPGLGKSLKLFEIRGEAMFFGLANDEIGYILSRDNYNSSIYKNEKSKSVGPETGSVIMTVLSRLNNPEQD